MDDGAKILDVSFGTFSCRLEGFSEPVETLKTVVAYMHEVVGHERFVEKAPIVAMPLADLATTDVKALGDIVAEQSGRNVDVAEQDGMLNIRAAHDVAEADDDEDTFAPQPEAFEEESSTPEEPAFDPSSLVDRLRKVREVVASGEDDDEPEASPDEPDSSEPAAAAPATDGSVAPGNPLAQRLAALARRANEETEADETELAAPAAAAPMRSDHDDDDDVDQEETLVLDPIARLRSSIAASTAPADDVQQNDDEEDGPAPLRLVATQRTDLNKHDATALRLQQIAAMNEDSGEEPSISFEDFVEEHDAADLPELVEAAAGYITFVEGEEDFTRPQVTKKLQLVVDDSVEREDILLTFGRLIRLGRIKKTPSGRFAVAADTPYRPRG